MAPLKALGDWATAPAATLQAPDQRYQARLLAGILLLFTLAIALTLPTQSSFEIQLTAIAALLALITAYGFSRTRAYRIAVWITSFVLSIGPFVVTYLSDPTTDTHLPYYLILAVLFSNFFFPLKTAGVMTLLNAAGLYLLPRFFGHPMSINHPRTHFLLFSSMILMYTYYRTQMEHAHMQALQESEVRYRALIENFPNGAILLYDHDLRYRIVGGTGLLETGLDADIISGKTIYEIFPPDICTLIEPYYRDALKGIEGVLEVPYQDHLYEMRSIPIRDKEGQIVAGMIMTQDITQQRQASIALQESETIYRALFEETPNPILIVNEEGRYLNANPAALSFLECSLDELLKKSIWDFTPPNQRAQQQAEHAPLVSHRTIEEDYWVHGHLKTLLLSVVPLQRSKGIELYGIGIDITGQKNAETALRHRLNIETLVATISSRFVSLSVESVDQEIQTTLKELGEFTGADRSRIILLAEDKTTIIQRYEWGAEGIKPEAKMGLGDSLSSFTWAMGKLANFEYLHIPRLADAPPEAQAEKELWRQNGTRSLLTLPLVMNQELIGFIGLSSCHEERAWIEEDIRLLTLAGEVIVNALARKQAAEARREILAAERAQRLRAETLAEVTLALTSQIKPAAILAEVLKQAQRIVPFENAGIVLTGLSTPSNFNDKANGDLWRTCEALSRLMEQVTQSGQPLVIPDIQEMSAGSSSIKCADVRSLLLMPISLRNQVLGILAFSSSHPGAFSTSDAVRLQPMANAAAIAIENARLVENLEVTVAARTAEIAAERDKSEAILRSTGDAIAMVDNAYRMQYVNQAFTKLTGYAPEETLGKPISLIDNDQIFDHARQSMALVLGQGRIWQAALVIRRKDGRTYDAALSIAPMHDAEGQLIGYVVSHQDISHSQALEKARNRFITSVSHQLRTPITTLQLYTQLLKGANRPETVAQYVQALETEAAQLSILIQDILELAELEAHPQPQQWQRLRPETLLKALITGYLHQAEQAGIALTMLPAQPDLPDVYGDPQRITQALKEILENALTFTPPGGEIILSAETREKSGQTWVTASVQDTGPGITPQDQIHLFDRFYRGKLAESEHIPGAGLGLCISQEIIAVHGGHITVESDLGTGSIFTLWFPAAATEQGKNPI